MRALVRATRRVGREVRRRWRRRGLGYATRLSGEFPVEIARFACPVIRPASQAHLVDNKLHNLRLAVGRMHGLVMAPGEAFSFWRLVGEPSIANGFREGPSFLDGEVVSSPGGGLCQLSGLLYNLALLSGMTIVERHPHSIDAYGPARYVPLARDATVAFDALDLAFANASPQPMALSLVVADHEVSGRVTAPAALPFAIEIESVELRTIEPHVIAHATRTRPGLVGREARASRIRRWPNGRVEVEALSFDVYRAVPALAAFGGDR